MCQTEPPPSTVSLTRAQPRALLCLQTGSVGTGQPHPLRLSPVPTGCAPALSFSYPSHCEGTLPAQGCWPMSGGLFVLVTCHSQPLSPCEPPHKHGPRLLCRLSVLWGGDTSQALKAAWATFLCLHGLGDRVTWARLSSLRPDHSHCLHTDHPGLLVGPRWAFSSPRPLLTSSLSPSSLTSCACHSQM